MNKLNVKNKKKIAKKVWTCKFLAFSLQFQKFFLITRTIFSYSRSEQFWKQNTISLCRWRRGAMETVSFLGWRSKASYQSPSVWNFNEPRSKLMSSEKRWWEEFDWFTNYSGIRSGHVHLSSFYRHFIHFLSHFQPQLIQIKSE